VTEGSRRSGGRQQSGEKHGTDGHGADLDIFARRVCTIADRSQAIEGGDAERGGEISVGAAARGAFAESVARLSSEQFCPGEERGADSTFHGCAVKSAVNFEARATKGWPQRMQAALEPVHVRRVKCAKVEHSASALGNDVDARAAFDDIGVDADTAPRIIPFIETSDLRGELVNGVDAFFRRKSGVGRTPVNDKFGFADAFPRGLEKTTRTERGLEDENCFAATRFGFDELS